MANRFCPRCHRFVPLPFKASQIRIEGTLTIGCPNCGKGRVTLGPNDLPKPKLEVDA